MQPLGKNCTEEENREIMETRGEGRDAGEHEMLALVITTSIEMQGREREASKCTKEAPRADNEGVSL